MPFYMPVAPPHENLTCGCGYVQVMAKYNVVFQYLLRLKRIQIDLESSWAVMRRQAGRSRDLPLHTCRLPLWHLRHHMAYIIANLQIYVQVRLLCFAVCRGREHLLPRAHVLCQDLSNTCKLPYRPTADMFGCHGYLCACLHLIDCKQITVFAHMILAAQPAKSMMHLCKQCTNLLQVDVIEAQSSVLSQCIANAQDFSEAERAHETFMDAVVTQSFLDMKAISQMLEGIFSLCQRLCGFVQVPPN